MYQQSGLSVNFIELSNPGEAGYISLGLQELMAYYSNRLSYDELRGLIERISGAELLSEQGIWNNVRQNVQRLIQ